MIQPLAQASILILLIVATFLWQKSDLSEFTIPFLGLLTFIYLISSFTKKVTIKPLSILILTVSAVLLILSTGGIQSPLFFLLYFLSFALAFSLAPVTVFAFNLTIFLCFLPEALQGDTIINIIKITSLILLCPLAYFFGKEVQLREQKALRAEATIKKIQTDISDVVKTEGATLKDQDVDKLADAIKQTRELEKETL